MSNYKYIGNKIAVHPGHFIEEYIDYIGMTQEELAYRIGTTPKNISILIRGEQSMTVDMANKLHRFTGVSVQFYLNAQASYDEMIEEAKNDKELVLEKDVYKELKYKYFRDNYELIDIPNKTYEQIVEVRGFLKISSLSLLKGKNKLVKFRSARRELTESNIIKANTMVLIATNKSYELRNIPKFDKKKFLRTVNYILTLTKDCDDFYKQIKKEFYFCGVDLQVIPNITGSKLNGATRIVGKHILLMLSDRYSNSDTFWFTLFHEIGHIINGDFGASFEMDEGEIEEKANQYAENMLIAPNIYKEFADKKVFTVESIKEFAEKINRNEGIILGRLQKDGLVKYNDVRFKDLKKKYTLTYEQEEFLLEKS